MEKQRIRAVGFKREAVTPGPAVSSAEKVDFIRKGKKKKTITKYQQNTNVTYRNEGDQIIVVEKEKKFDETGVARKKRNYVMYESKLGTEKERDWTKIAAKKMRKPQPRVEDKIVITRKKKQYLDNYQYHETKYIKEPPKPQNTSFVFHQRLSEPVGGTYETITYDRRTIKTNDGALGYRQSSLNTRNKPNRNVPSNLTYNRHLKTQTGLLNNTTTNARNKKPMNIPKSTTSDSSRLRQMPKSSTNDSSGLRQVVKTTRIRREVKTINAPVPKESKLPSLLKNTDNSLANKEKEKEKTEKTEKPQDADKTEKTENVEDKKEPENDNVPKENEKNENAN